MKCVSLLPTRKFRSCAIGQSYPCAAEKICNPERPLFSAMAQVSDMPCMVTRFWSCLPRLLCQQTSLCDRSSTFSIRYAFSLRQLPFSGSVFFQSSITEAGRYVIRNFFIFRREPHHWRTTIKQQRRRMETVCTLTRPSFGRRLHIPSSLAVVISCKARTAVPPDTNGVSNGPMKR